MKLSNLAKIGCCAILVACIGLYAHDLKAQSTAPTTENLAEDINITIDKSTADKDFQDIEALLKDYGISVEFSNIRRNDSNDITAIGITLSTANGQQAQSQMSGNRPISQMSFGRKKGQLYIGQGEQPLNAFGFFGGANAQLSPFDNDSIFKDHFKSFDKFNIDDFFNDKAAVFMFNGDSLTIEELKDKMMQNFSFKNPTEDRFSFIFDDNFDTSEGPYHFVDDPNKDKVIVIDGNISDFKTLDALAKADKIDKVDILKPETAMSIYGAKAKDGALIVTTK